MNPATTEFVRQRFTEYYQKAMLVSPPSLAQREWGFVLFAPGAAEMRMRRHIAFTDRRELFDYIQNLVPSHLYYSSAYYEKPDAPTMGEKGWCGADLIFDLDADHIVKGPYDQMLSRVKAETEKLLAMLTGELGIDPKKIDLVFSGGRGTMYTCGIWHSAGGGAPSGVKWSITSVVSGSILSSCSPGDLHRPGGLPGSVRRLLITLHGLAP